MTDVVIPIKTLSQAKSRLAGVLSQPERAELVLAMFTDLLTAVATIDMGRIWVVASDDEVFDIARQFDARLVPEATVQGYNAAISLGFTAVPDGVNLAVLPGDVPLVTRVEIAALIQPAECLQPVIRLAPDHDRMGTNGLFLSSRDLMRPGFGPDSFNRHCTIARAAGIEPTILKAPCLAHDIDTTDDLDDFATLCSHGATCSFLRTIGMQPTRKISGMGAT